MIQNAKTVTIGLSWYGNGDTYFTYDVAGAVDNALRDQKCPAKSLSG